MAEISRRSFIAQATATGVTAGAALTAAQVSIAKADEASWWLPESWDYETDIVIVGFGAAGGASMITACEEGAEVIIIEKGSQVGGGSSSLGGGNITFINDVEASIEYLHACNGGYTPEEVERAWCEIGSTTDEWFDDHDINYAATSGASGPEFKYIMEDNDFLTTLQMVSETDPKTQTGGNYFIEYCRNFSEENGVTCLVSTQAYKLVQDPQTKEVLGVLGHGPEGDVAVKARKAVILCTGGFEASETMQGDYLRPTPLAQTGWPLNTGDGIKMAMAAGADLWHMPNVCSTQPTFVEPGKTIGYAGFAGSWWAGGSGAFFFINRKAKRFMQESPLPFPNFLSQYFFSTYNEALDQPNDEYLNVPFYMIFDETQRQAGALYNNIPNGVRQLPDDLKAEYGTDHVWSADNLEEVEMGWILKADTIEELAAQIDLLEVEPSVLAETLAHYNEICEAQVDDEYGRPAEKNGNPNLVPLNNPPFYALKLQPALYSTCGGPRKNEKGQIIDTEGNPIPRLYEAGVLGHISGKVYSCAGMNYAECINWGRISGANAAAEQSWE